MPPLKNFSDLFFKTKGVFVTLKEVLQLDF